MFLFGERNNQVGITIKAKGKPLRHIVFHGRTLPILPRVALDDEAHFAEIGMHATIVEIPCTGIAHPRG